jgi:hypothetical protein
MAIYSRRFLKEAFESFIIFCLLSTSFHQIYFVYNLLANKSFSKIEILFI